MATTSRRRQDPSSRREQLLDAAQAVLLSKGLRSTTVADVAETAGVAKGTTYLYFDSKDALLAGLRARYLERFVAALQSAPDAPAEARLTTFVEGMYRVATEQRALHHALFHEAGFSEADAFGAVRALLEEILATGAANDELTIDDVQVTASFLLHGLHGLMVDDLHTGRIAPSPAVGALLARATGAPPARQ
jgi:AcrR family transcriptional regulator